MDAKGHFKEKKGITVSAARRVGAKYTATDLARFAESYHKAKSKEEKSVDVVAFLWWLDSYYSRGVVKNKDGKLEPHWSNIKEAADLWDGKKAPTYTAIELKEKFLAASGKGEE